jgi:hypothetical protein
MRSPVSRGALGECNAITRVTGVRRPEIVEQREYLGIMLENARKIRAVLDSALDGAPPA